MDNITKFFKIWQFLSDNPYIALQKKIEVASLQYPDTTELYSKILNFNQAPDGTPTSSWSYPKDADIINTALTAREKMWKYFSKVLVPGSYAYNTADMDLYRLMIIDWASASRAFKDLFRHASNAYSLDDDDVDKAIRGFGVDFINKETLNNINNRHLYLLAMAELYKIKGTPQSILTALTFTDIHNAVIREYWIERDPYNLTRLQIRGKAIGKNKQHLDTNPDNLLTTYNQYVFDQDPSHFIDTVLPWETFQNRLIDIGDPHWWYTSKEILDLELSNDSYIKLPSAMPYFGIEFYTDFEKYTVVVSILEKMLSDQLNSFISGSGDMVPKEISISGYNSDLTQKDLWVAGYKEPISMLESFLAFTYCQIRYDEYLEYKNLYDFLVAHHIVPPSFTYPWTVQNLILWGWDHRHEYINDIISIDSVLRMYQRPKSHYYCATNELTNWWKSLGRSGDIPSIFFSTEYNFQYNPDPQDTEKDQILYYSGSRKLNLKSTPFEYLLVVDDEKRIAATQTSRVPYTNDQFKSYFNNKQNSHYPLTQDVQSDYNNLFYDYISWVSPDYLDRETHDGSQITPFYNGKYPKDKRWNWGIDSEYLYICVAANTWIRTTVETSWTNGPTMAPTANSPQPNISTADKLGYQFYQNGYIYSYISNNKWVRYLVETDWNYCDSPISSSGHIQLTSDIAHKSIKAKIDASIAQNYIDGNTTAIPNTFNITIDPLGTSTVHQYDLLKLDSYLNKYLLTVESSGYIIEDFSYYFQSPYLYIRSVNSDTNEIVWVRKLFSTEWTRLNNESSSSSVNGNKIFEGNYKYPNLDLTNRYDAERILKGTFVLSTDNLIGLDKTTNGGEILVASTNTASGGPETWMYDENSSSWIKTPTNRINDINLGINNDLYNWINSVVKTETDYDKYAIQFLNAFSNYVSVQFHDPDLDIAAIYKNIKNSGIYKDIINFYKPKRARLLYFSIVLEFDERIFNSIIVDDTMTRTKIVQEINTYVPRNDGIYVTDDTAMYNYGYHLNDITTSLDIPVNSVYGKAVYYLTGFEEGNVNGFYFRCDELGDNGLPFYLNYHGVCLTRIVNDELINGYQEEWIIAYRKSPLTWCDALYVNYSTELNNNWNTQDFDILTSSSTSSSSSANSNRKIIDVDSLTINDVPEWDKTKINDISNYDLGVINQWNIKHPRTEPGFIGFPYSSSSSYPDKYQEKTSRDPRKLMYTDITVDKFRGESHSLRHWTYALCKDPYNFRRIFPPPNGDWMGAGYPENVNGERIDQWDADSRNNGNNEFSYTYWRSDYPYSDDQLVLRDIAVSPIGLRTVSWLQIGSRTNNYNAPYLYTNPLTNETINIPSWWTNTIITYYSGPVHHRPLYIAIQTTINDCYPCRPPECCDYYDIGCFHDGPTNPQVVKWLPESQMIESSSSSTILYNGHWEPGQYSSYSIKNLNYDAFTTYNKATKEFITDPDEQIHYDSEADWTSDLINPGSTYCHECDDPLFTPDMAFYEIPERWKDCGIYHEEILGTGFADNSLNVLWTVSENLQSTSGYDDFPIGYVNSNDDELVHVYHRESGYHYWEIRRTPFLLNAGDTYTYTDGDLIGISFTGGPGTTATVIVNGVSIMVGNIDGYFVWDVGGTQYIFFEPEDVIVRNINGSYYLITFDGFGSLDFHIEKLDMNNLTINKLTKSTVPWNQLRQAVQGLVTNNQTVTFSYSFIKENTPIFAIPESNSNIESQINPFNQPIVNAYSVPLEHPNLTHQDFIDVIMDSLNEWKNTLEYIFSQSNGYNNNLTVNFENLGEEISNRPYENNKNNYVLNNIGDLRFGGILASTQNSTLAYGVYPGFYDMESGTLEETGNIGGDILINVNPTINWYKSGQMELNIESSSSSLSPFSTSEIISKQDLKLIIVHELGHALCGLDHDLNSTSVMAKSIDQNTNKLKLFDSRYPNGLKESPFDVAAVTESLDFNIPVYDSLIVTNIDGNVLPGVNHPSYGLYIRDTSKEYPGGFYTYKFWDDTTYKSRKIYLSYLTDFSRTNLPDSYWIISDEHLQPSSLTDPNLLDVGNNSIVYKQKIANWISNPESLDYRKIIDFDSYWKNIYPSVNLSFTGDVGGSLPASPIELDIQYRDTNILDKDSNNFPYWIYGIDPGIDFTFDGSIDSDIWVFNGGLRHCDQLYPNMISYGGGEPIVGGTHLLKVGKGKTDWVAQIQTTGDNGLFRSVWKRSISDGIAGEYEYVSGETSVTRVNIALTPPEVGNIFIRLSKDSNNWKIQINNGSNSYATAITSEPDMTSVYPIGNYLSDSLSNVTITV